MNWRDEWKRQRAEDAHLRDLQYIAARQRGELLCNCPTPAPDTIGECEQCHRLVDPRGAA